jgi:hypothetical protein
LTWEIQHGYNEGDRHVKIGWRVYFGLLLIALSLLLYLVHFYVFHDLEHIEIYALGDVAFLPIEVLLVVLVVDWVISRQEQRSQLSLLRLLENPSLLEQESFTEQLWAVFHVADELQHRSDLAHLPGGDYRHLALDTGRAYSALTAEWLKYMAHLLKRYPYLFSLALRTNPFDPTASPVITDAG